MSIATPAASTAPVTSVDALLGLWRRSLISWPGRASDTTTRVHWLQSARAYVDLRQPADAPNFTHVRCHDDLTLEDCAWLARQEGFAGELKFKGSQFFQWHRAIDYQPRSPTPDAGSLHWNDDVLIETGVNAVYVEHWHRDPSIPTSPARLLTLPKATFVSVGPYFMYARDRVVPLTKGYRTLSESVAAAPDIAHARALVDCEISFGAVEQGGLHITASTLPYKVGSLLELAR